MEFQMSGSEEELMAEVPTEEEIADIFKRTAEQENVFLYLLSPLYLFGVVGSLSVAAAVVASPSLHKPRHVFQVVGLANTLVGAFIGVYGFIFLLQRTGHMSPGGETSSFTLLHLFLLHRYLLMLGDLLPSLDRCAAVLFPLRYAVGATCSGACALVAAAALLAAALTAAANMAGVVPGHLTQIDSALRPFSLFFLLSSSTFVPWLSLPYLGLAAFVLVCDFTSLVIAITKGKRTRRQTSSSGCDVTTTLSSSGGASSKANSNKRKMLDGRSRSSTLSFEEGGAEERRKKYVGMRQQLRKQGSSTARSMSPSFSDPSGSPTTTIASAAAAATAAARREEQKRRDARIELRISIRCLATTLWFFLHQMCTFLPGIFLYGCDQFPAGDDAPADAPLLVRRGCLSVVGSPWPRVFLFFFYQLQFLKPVFYYAMDRELAAGIRRFWKKILRPCACEEDLLEDDFGGSSRRIRAATAAGKALYEDNC